MRAKVTDYMTRKVITVTADTGIRDAFFKMKENRIRHLPVTDDDRKVIGIISDRGLRRPKWVDEARDIAHVYHLDDNMSVGDLMITQVHVLHTYDTLSKAVRLLLEQDIGAAPVLDKNEQLAGILSAVDLLRALNDTIEAQRRKS